MPTWFWKNNPMGDTIKEFMYISRTRFFLKESSKQLKALKAIDMSLWSEPNSLPLLKNYLKQALVNVLQALDQTKRDQLAKNITQLMYKHQNQFKFEERNYLLKYVSTLRTCAKNLNDLSRDINQGLNHSNLPKLSEKLEQILVPIATLEFTLKKLFNMKKAKAQTFA